MKVLADDEGTELCFDERLIVEGRGFGGGGGADEAVPISNVADSGAVDDGGGDPELNVGGDGGECEGCINVANADVSVLDQRCKGQGSVYNWGDGQEGLKVEGET